LFGGVRIRILMENEGWWVSISFPNSTMDIKCPLPKAGYRTMVSFMFEENIGRIIFFFGYVSCDFLSMGVSGFIVTLFVSYMVILLNYDWLIITIANCTLFAVFYIKFRLWSKTLCNDTIYYSSDINYTKLLWRKYLF
jgi:hypothetical protein